MENKTGAVFIDTNILIYAYSSTEPEKKEKVLSILENRTVFLSTQVINEFIWVMNKKYNVNMEKLKLIMNNLYDLYEVRNIGRLIIEKAIELSQKHKFAYWDSLILASALHSECSSVYSEDLQHDQIIEDKLKIENPFILSAE